MLQNKLKKMSAMSLLAVAALTLAPTSALAGQHQRGAQQSTANAVARGNHARAVNNIHQSIYQIYLGAPGYPSDPYGYGSDPQTQISSQQAHANAIAAGDNSTAISNIDQTNYQNGYGYPSGYGYPNGYDYPSGYGYPNDPGYQNGYGSPVYWDGGYGYGADPQTQTSSQQAHANAIAAGDNSTAISNIDQTNYQNGYGYPNDAGYPAYWGNGYGW